jgi:phenylacetate-CoA ligase
MRGASRPKRHQGLRHLRPVRDHRPGRRPSSAPPGGLHIFEDHFYPEIIDPETGEVLPDGEEGELVLTTLSKQAMPMIRYRTRDITSSSRALRLRPHHPPHPRIGRRSDDMFIIRGVNVFPSQIEAALLAVEGTLPHYQIVLTREKGLDEMEVQVEVTPEVFSDKIGALESLQQASWSTPSSTRGDHHPAPKGRPLVEPHTIQRSEGKAKRMPRC